MPAGLGYHDTGTQRGVEAGKEGTLLPLRQDLRPNSGGTGLGMAAETKYTTDEGWLRIDGDTGTVGITNYAQEQLKDLVFVKLPKVGERVTKGKEAASVE